MSLHGFRNYYIFFISCLLFLILTSFCYKLFIIYSVILTFNLLIFTCEDIENKIENLVSFRTEELYLQFCIYKENHTTKSSIFFGISLVKQTSTKDVFAKLK